MSRNCAHCGAPLPKSAQVCSQCGQPVSAGSTASGRGFRFGPAVIGFTAVGLCLCLVMLVGVLLWRSGGLPLGQDTPAVAVLGEVNIDEASLQQLEASVDRIEDAFRAGDVAAVNDMTHPALRDSYGPIFTAHQGELSRVADLLATRHLLAAMPGMAEYEVTEDGRTFTVTFEQWGDQWYLSSL